MEEKNTDLKCATRNHMESVTCRERHILVSLYCATLIVLKESHVSSWAEQEKRDRSWAKLLVNWENLKNNFVIFKLDKSSIYSKLQRVSVMLLMMKILIIITTATVITMIQIAFLVAALGTITASGRGSTTGISWPH